MFISKILKRHNIKYVSSRFLSTEIEKIDMRSDRDITNEKFIPSLIKNFVIPKFYFDVAKFPGIHNTEYCERSEKLADQFNQLIKQAIVNGEINKLIKQLKSTGLYNLTLPSDLYGSNFYMMMLLPVIESFRHDHKIFYDNFLNQTLVSKCIGLGFSETNNKEMLHRVLDPQNNYFISFENLLNNEFSLTCEVDNDDFIIDGQINLFEQYKDNSNIIIFAKLKDEIICAEINTESENISKDSENILILNSVKLKKDNIVSLKNGKMILNKMFECHFVMSSSLIGSMIKGLLEEANEFISNRQLFGRPLESQTNIQKHISNLTLRHYQAQSAAYYIAGFIDMYPSIDLTLETRLAKIICIEALQDAVNDALSIMSLSEFEYRKSFSYIYHNCIEVLKIENGKKSIREESIVLGRELMEHGLSEISVQMKDWSYRIEQIYSWTSLLGVANTPSQKRYFYYPDWDIILHPRIADRAKPLIEYLNKQLAFMEKRYKKSKRSKQPIDDLLAMEIGMFTVDVLACVSTLTRATRSISIGLRNCDTEVQLAEVFVEVMKPRLKERVERIRDMDKREEHIRDTVANIRHLKLK